jgi:TPR repeat protein
VYKGDPTAIFASLTFLDGGEVEVDAQLVQVRRSYFVEGDTLRVRLDKGFLSLQWKDAKTLRALESDASLGTAWAQSTPSKKSCREATRSEEVSRVERDKCAWAADEEVRTRKNRNAYARCCELGDGESCNRHGMVLDLLGQRTEAKDLYLKACKLRSGAGCGNAADVASREGDRPGAQKLLQAGCILHHADSCLKLESLGTATP